MAADVQDSKAEERSLIDAEERRCQAVNDGDWDAVDAVLGADYFYVHSNGRLENRAEQFASLQNRHRVLRREDLAARVYGDTGILTGTMMMRFEEDGYADKPVLDLLQVWIKQDGAWTLVAHHGTPKRHTN